MANDKFSRIKEVNLFSGGTFSAVGDRECTHLVIDEAVTELPDVRLPKHVVKGEVSSAPHKNGKQG